MNELGIGKKLYLVFAALLAMMLLSSLVAKVSRPVIEQVLLN